MTTVDIHSGQITCHLRKETAHHRSELEGVRVAVGKILTDEHRSIFTLHYFQHLSLQEVATRIDRPVGTVKVYLHRARKMVLSHLSEKK